MRSKRSAVLVFMIVTLLLPTAVVSAQTEDVYRFEGGGWGHGVGMSQYGAYGQALEGRTYPEILAHYYQGTGLAAHGNLELRSDALTTVPDALWVGIEQNQTKMTFEAIGGPLDLCQANDGTGPCPRPEHPQPGETWTFEKVSGGCRFFLNGAPVGPQAGACRASISWDDTTTRIKIDGHEYRYGTVKLRTSLVAAGNFHISLAIDLEDYMRGIAEMPAYWSQEALRSQAVAARTFAVYRFLTYERPTLRTESDAGFADSRKTSCWCHVYDWSIDQVYLGYANEIDADSPNWLEAIAATSGQVVIFEGEDWPSFTRDKVAGAFYFSSTAGATESNTDGFGSSIDYPYLISVDDHWSSDPGLNPNAYWEKDVSGSVLAAALGWDSVGLVDLLNPAPGASVMFTGMLNGSEVTATKGPAWLQINMGLPSPHVTGLVGDPEGPPQTAEDPAILIHPFTDLVENPHERAIDTIWQLDITTGCTLEQYCPADPVPRWQMALFLIRLWPLTGYDVPGDLDQGFTDLGGLSEEASAAVNRLVSLEITQGFSETEFAPFAEVSRWQMALFLTRLVTAAGVQLPDGSAQGFTDLGALPQATQTAINQLKQLAITTGATATTFAPDRNVRRDEMASFLSRTLDLVAPIP